jgi:hypothetical protein
LTVKCNSAVGADKAAIPLPAINGLTTYDSANFHSLYTPEVKEVKPVAKTDTTAEVKEVKPVPATAPVVKAFHYSTYTVTPAVDKIPAVTVDIVTLGANAVAMAMSFATLLISASFL